MKHIYVLNDIMCPCSFQPVDEHGNQKICSGTKRRYSYILSWTDPRWPSPAPVCLGGLVARQSMLPLESGTIFESSTTSPNSITWLGGSRKKSVALAEMRSMMANRCSLHRVAVVFALGMTRWREMK